MARRRRDALVQPVGAGMGAKGHPQHAVLAGNGREALAQVGQRGPRLTHLDARAGGDFKLALQHLVLYLGQTFGTNGCNEVRRYIADRWLCHRWLRQFICNKIQFLIPNQYFLNFFII
ncbi:MAG: hypothetical protein NTW00_05420 [Hyphomicrobiales bacterium]|nr:hypothetical protein [Hyphomicrobiales bacterium]